jgi:hypothetical protein
MQIQYCKENVHVNAMQPAEVACLMLACYSSNMLTHFDVTSESHVTKVLRQCNNITNQQLFETQAGALSARPSSNGQQLAQCIFNHGMRLKHIIPRGKRAEVRMSNVENVGSL